MITIDYKLSKIWNQAANRFDLASADESAFRYNLFLGDMIFRVNECDLSAEWGWVPVIDFAASLRYVSSELEQASDAESTLDFTESSSMVHFQRHGDSVTISADYAACQADIPLSEFVTVVNEFSHRVLAALLQEHPALMQNSALRELLPA